MHRLAPDDGPQELGDPGPRRGRRMFGPVVLATGIVLGALYATPEPFNPLVQMGVLVTAEPADDAPIVMIATTIAVQPSDLPAQRPSLATARAIDDIEAAHFVGAAASRATGIVAADETPTDATLKEPEPPDRTTASVALPLPKARVPPALTQTTTLKRRAGTTGADEDFMELKKRAFNSER